MKAFGLTGRMAAPVEKELVKKWTGEFGFTIDIIVEACSRTVSATHQASFEYSGQDPDKLASERRTSPGRYRCHRCRLYEEALREIGFFPAFRKEDEIQQF